MALDDSPCPVIATAYVLFHGTKPETFAELLVEHLTEHGWTLVRANQEQRAATSEAEPE